MVKSWAPLIVGVPVIGGNDSFMHAENFSAFLNNLGATSSSEVVILSHNLRTEHNGEKVEPFLETVCIVYCEEGEKRSDD